MREAYDKVNERIFIIEIGITSVERLKECEYDKLHKYQVLARELKNMERMPVNYPTLCNDLDEVVTNYNYKYRAALGITNRIQAYIQTVALGKTMEMIMPQDKFTIKPSKQESEPRPHSRGLFTSNQEERKTKRRLPDGGEGMAKRKPGEDEARKSETK